VGGGVALTCPGTSLTEPNISQHPTATNHTPKHTPQPTGFDLKYVEACLLIQALIQAFGAPALGETRPRPRIHGMALLCFFFFITCSDVALFRFYGCVLFVALFAPALDETRPMPRIGCPRRWRATKWCRPSRLHAGPDTGGGSGRGGTRDNIVLLYYPLGGRGGGGLACEYRCRAWGKESGVGISGSSGEGVGE
jgi:hypothetical protein